MRRYIGDLERISENKWNFDAFVVESKKLQLRSNIYIFFGGIPGLDIRNVLNYDVIRVFGMIIHCFQNTNVNFLWINILPIYLSSIYQYLIRHVTSLCFNPSMFMVQMKHQMLE